jgi:PTS system N-acetylglucosamine-specific IIC component
VAACTTRLRLRLVDNQAIDEAMLKRLGARGILRSSAQGLQVVLGPIADQVAGEIRGALRSAPPAVAPVRAAHDAAALLAALGGRPNVMDLETAAGRLLIRTARPESIDEAALAKLGIRGDSRLSATSGADRLRFPRPEA